MNDRTLKGMGSHELVDWFTPRSLFDYYDNGEKWQFHFTTDPCTDARNPLGCKVFYTKEDNGLEQPWHGNVWVNPPYGSEVDKWVPKCAEYARSGEGGAAVMLIAARPDTLRFHKYIWDREKGRPRENVYVDFLPGRVKFLLADGKPSNSPFFASMVVIFYPPLPNTTACSPSS